MSYKGEYEKKQGVREGRACQGDGGNAVSRRRWLSRMGLLSLSAGSATSLLAKMGSHASGGLSGARGLFEVKSTYLNNASIHPIAKGAAKAVEGYLDGRLMNTGEGHYHSGEDRDVAMRLFGEMVNADSDELAWIPSTMVGENLVVDGLELPVKGGRVVTDEYHFMGSMFMYQELQDKGLELEVVAARNSKIALEDLDKAITPGTRLVALTLVSNVAGFQHDLKAVCELAHARGAMVYADIIQAAGCTPIDLRESGVDFAACATYKWLMGDFGVGFMYARRESQSALKRTRLGYRQRQGYRTFYTPFDEPSDQVATAELREGLAGLVEVGTLASGGVAALTYSLQLLTDLGVENIEAWRRPLVMRLQEALPSAGFLPMTPVDSRSAVVSFACRDAAGKLNPRLAKAGVEVSVYANYVRVSPSFFNSMDDVEQLIEALGTV